MCSGKRRKRAKQTSSGTGCGDAERSNNDVIPTFVVNGCAIPSPVLQLNTGDKTVCAAVNVEP